MINNNPLNIRYSKKNHWLGQIGARKGFVLFDTLSHGVRAAIIVLKNYYRLHHLRTISSIIRRYAPECENDTESYIHYVSQRAHFAPSEPLSLDQVIYDVLPAMAFYESHTTLAHDLISFVVSTQNINIYEKG